MKKKILSTILAIAMLISVMPCVYGTEEIVTENASVTLGEEQLEAELSTEEIISGDFKYTVNYDGTTATITNYTGSIDVLEIPSKLDGYTVTRIGNSAFSCSSLTSITIPDSVTIIGSWAFDGCRSLTSITIPNSVTSIGDHAFYNCRSLTSITIPESVTSIGDYAFYDCRSLTSITIPNSVTSIGDYAFFYCISLTSITIPESVTSIGESAFYDCSSLTSITIPDSVTSIGDYAFDGCSSLVSITIPESITSIGDGAFYYCNVLTEIIVDKNNESYKSVDGILFDKAITELIQYPIGNTRESYVIPDSVTSIGDYAFSGCSSLISIVIPKSVESIGYRTFWNCSSLTDIKVNENNESYKSVDGILFNKTITELIQYPIGNTKESYAIPDSVTSIGSEAFYNCSSLTSITIPKGVKSIGDGAFSGTALYNNEENWDNNVLYIDNCLIDAKTDIVGDYEIRQGTVIIADSAFSGCSSLTSITIPDSVTSIDEWAFSHCGSLTSITIPESVTSIGERAFNFCGRLTSITIPDSVTSLGVDVFYGTAIYHNEKNWDNKVLYINNCLIEAKSYIVGDYEIRKGTVVIADKAFEDCSSLTSITIPAGVTSIGADTFSRCSGLTSITIPDSVTRIGSGAFFYCRSLTSITIPESVTRIGAYTFSYCSGLTSITIPESVTSIGSRAFYNCSSLTSITIPESVTSIGDSAFRSCSNLISITIPDSVTSIGRNAFYNCSSLTSVTIPDSITSIGDGAFYYCDVLTEIIVDENNKNYKSVDGVLFNKAMTQLIQYPKRNTRESYVVPADVTSIGERAFFSCRSLKSITISDSVTRIGNSAFSYCILTSITIPDSVTNIADDTFYYCSSLTSVTIPDSVTSIDNEAFRGCSSLTDVYYSGTEAQWNKISIDDGNEPLTTATIHFLGTGDTTSPSINETAVTVTKNDENNTYIFNVPLENVTEPCRMIVAIYDENGAISGIEEVEVAVGDTEKTANVTAENAAAAKVFLWGDLLNLKPLCSSVEKEIN